MRPVQQNVGRADAAAISLSGLCLIHCLVLPLLAAFVPVLGVYAEMEWVHKGLVIAAAPISLFALTRTEPGGGRIGFGVLMALGLGLLVTGAFVEALHDYEVQLTVAGALTLSIAHLFRWVSHRR